MVSIADDECMGDSQLESIGDTYRSCSPKSTPMPAFVLCLVLVRLDFGHRVK